MNDLDFSDDEQSDINIFYKDIIDCDKIYDRINKNKKITKDELHILDNTVSAFSVKDKGDLKKIINFYKRDKYCKHSLNWLDVSGITDMSRLFAGQEYNYSCDWCYYTGDISKWDVSNVTNMCSMFSVSFFNNDISDWDVSNVTNMAEMFGCSKFNNDISKWDVSSVTYMDSMFCKSKFNQDISHWDVSHVTSMKGIFSKTQFDQDISQWNVSSVIYMNYMF